MDIFRQKSTRKREGKEERVENVERQKREEEHSLDDRTGAFFKESFSEK